MNDLIYAMILEGIAGGTSLMQLCREYGIKRHEVYVWRDQSDENRAAFIAARENGMDTLAEQCMQIADDDSEDGEFTERGRRLNSEFVQRSKLRIETRLKLLACWDPKRYAPTAKVDATVRSTSVTIPAETVDPSEAMRIYNDVMRGVDGPVNTD